MDYSTRVKFEKKDIAYWSMVAGLVLFILFLHLYRLDELPKGMEVDEVGMAYDSWCIGNYGVDRYLNSFPVYLNNYGGGQSTMYCYLAVPFLKNAGFSAAMARMPGVLFSMLTCIVGFDLIRKVRGKLAALIYLFLFAALPYFTQSGRIALDCNLMLGCTVVILYILEFCLRQGERLWPYVLLGVFTGISLYSYALSNMIYPVFFLLLYPLLLVGGKRISWKQILVFFIPAFVIAIPLILVQVVNIAKTQNMMIGPLTIPRIDFYRLTEISIHEVRPNIGWIFRSLFTADNQEFDSFPQFGALYMISLPMIIAGFVITFRRSVKSIREKRISFETIILFYTIIMMAFALVLLGVTTYRINAVFFGLTYLIMVPIEACFTAEKNKKAFMAAGIVLVAAYTLYAGAFLSYYFTRYEKDYYPQRLFAENPKEVYEFLEGQSEEIKSRLTYVGGVNEAYAYFLLAMKISPYDYDVKELGNNGDGKKYLFYAPEPYDTGANYCFYLPDADTDKAMTELGFIAHDLGPYRVYIY
ncbi:MAG: glycosyltransferase family 39 protein [Butyrivibrio sp.]|nr:glycosyltransferase family 39 protein [Butyrivibrio sp.]